MSRNPLVNALTASAYIVLVAFVMDLGTKTVRHPNSFLAPIALISLFTLSAAVMGYLFCYESLQLYFEGKKKAAVKIFLQTVAIFGVLTTFALTLLFSGLFQ
jgi:hypothetical protein